jgi:hypothetical protein
VLWDIAGRLLAALLPQQAACRAARAGAALFLAGTCLLAASRTAALLVNYGAPMRIYNHLPEVGCDANRRSGASTCPAFLAVQSGHA